MLRLRKVVISTGGSQTFSVSRSRFSFIFLCHSVFLPLSLSLSRSLSSYVYIYMCVNIQTNIAEHGTIRTRQAKAPRFMRIQQATTASAKGSMLTYFILLQSHGMGDPETQAPDEQRLVRACMVHELSAQAISRAEPSNGYVSLGFLKSHS